MKNNILISLLVFLFLFSCQEELKIKENKQNFKEIADKIKDTFDKKELKKTKYFLKEYLKEAKLQTNLLYTGKAYFRLGVYYKKFNQTDSAYYFYGKSITYFNKIKDSIRLGKVLLNMAIIESDFSDYYKSDSTAVKALGYLKNKGIKYISGVYNCMGVNTRKKKEYEKSLQFYDKAIKYSKSKKEILAYKNNKANIYKDIKQYHKSIDILEDVLNGFIIKKHPKKEARVKANLAYTKWKQDSTLNVLPELLEAEAIRKEENDFIGLISNYEYLSSFFKYKNAQKSLGYAYKMYNIAKQEKSPINIIIAIDKIIELEKTKKAVQYAIKRNKLKDSLYEVKDKSQNKYALIKYESTENEKKAIKSKLLLEKQKSQKAKIIFSGIILLILFVLYLIYKHQKSKKEKVIEVYKTETRLAKKIHDELANNIYLIMNKVQNVNMNPIELLPDLKNIYNLTRNISHENSLVLTGDKFESFLKQLFSEFNKRPCKVFTKGLNNININNISSEKQIVVYRVLQEILINMKKHSKATLIIIDFIENKRVISIIYKDNGVGFSDLKIKNGLQNMDTRIKSIKGLFSFDSEEGGGFKASIQFKR